MVWTTTTTIFLGNQRYRTDRKEYTEGPALMHHYRVDQEFSNSHTIWQKLGSPQQPLPEQYRQVEEAGHLKLFTSPQWIAGKRKVHIFVLPCQDRVSLSLNLNGDWEIIILMTSKYKKLQKFLLRYIKEISFVTCEIIKALLWISHFKNPKSTLHIMFSWWSLRQEISWHRKTLMSENGWNVRDLSWLLHVPAVVPEERLATLPGMLWNLWYSVILCETATRRTALPCF